MKVNFGESHLPLDILMTLVELAVTDDDHVTLGALACTTPSLTEHCQRRIFENASLGVVLSTNKQDSKFTGFAQAVERKPFLADVVKSLTLEVRGVDTTTKAPTDFGESIYAVVRCLTGLEKLSIRCVDKTEPMTPTFTRLDQCIVTRIFDVITSPCLTTLHLSSIFLWISPPPKTTFANVHTLILNNQSLFLEGFEDQDEPPLAPETIEFTSKFDFRRNPWSSFDYIRQGLVSPKRLKSLSLDSGLEADQEGAVSVMTLARRTLELIRVNALRYEFLGAVLHPAQRELFTKLHSLKTVAIRTQTYSGQISRAIEGAMVASASPHLKTIEFHFEANPLLEFVVPMVADWKELDERIRDGKFGRVENFAIVGSLTRMWIEKHPDYSYKRLTEETGALVKEYFVYSLERGVNIRADYVFEKF